MEFSYDTGSMGITERSLRVLKRALDAKGRKALKKVIQVDTWNTCCGFAVYYPETDSVVFTGDGFRTDGGGEGGAGYVTALRLLGRNKLTICKRIAIVVGNNSAYDYISQIIRLVEQEVLEGGLGG